MTPLAPVTMRMLRVTALLCSIPALAHAHGALVSPLSRNAIDGGEVGCGASTDGCTAAATNCLVYYNYELRQSQDTASQHTNSMATSN